MKWWLLAAMVVGLGAGCSVGPDDDLGGAPPGERGTPEPPTEEPSEEVPAEPAAPACVDAERWRAIRVVHQAAEDSVHELVTCGQAQMAVVGSMVAIVLFSNPQFFAEATVDELEELLGYAGLVGKSPFTHTPDGRHVMPINERSRFEVGFYAPGAAADAPRLPENVFDLESYLKSARVETSLSWEQMKADPNRKNVYTVTWEAPGPLAEVMFPDGVPPEGRFELALSIWDFLFLFGFHDEEPDFGPFAHLASLAMDSTVTLVDERPGAEVAYAFGGERGVLADLRSAGQVGFQLLSLRATDGEVTLEGDAGDLRYRSLGALAGRLVYRVADPELYVVDDFGAGAAYPEVEFYCPADWPPPEHEDLAR